MIGFIADIHGNFPALCSVLRELQLLGADEIYSLGDVAGYYCMINECCELLRKRSIPNIMGNHDFYLTTGRPCPRSATANLCLDHQSSVVTTENLLWLSRSEPLFEMKDFIAWHGGPDDPLDQYVENFTFPNDSVRSLFLAAHTHKQKLCSQGELVFCNPGSVGQPRDGDPRAAFAVCEKGKVTLCRVKYDIDEIAKKMHGLGFEDRITECLYKGLPIAPFVPEL